MNVAIDGAYLAERISDRIAKTPEGYWICLGAVIGRTGFQEYLVSEIEDPEGLLKDHNRGDTVSLWRDPSEVFSPATIASFEGKTFTYNHPDKLLSPENEKQHHDGHVSNVRKGTAPLDSGDWPMLADIFATDEDIIRAIADGKRELSCGYSYTLAKTGERFDQTKIVGNHVALVDKARAGAQARINDSATVKKETPMATNYLKRIFGLGWKAFAADAKPEEMADAMEEIKAKDAELPEKKEEKAEHLKDEKTCEKCEKPMDKCTCDKKGKAKDAAHEERRARMHSAVDRLMDAHGLKDMVHGKDADLEELKSLLGEFFTEEEKEKEHGGDKAAKDAAAEEKEKAEKAAKDAAAEKEKAEKEAAEKGKDKAKDEGEEVAPISQSDSEKEKEEGKDREIVNPEPVLEKKEIPQSQFDSIFAAGNLDALKRLRPMIAKSNDKALIARFNTALDSAKAVRDGKAPAATAASYASFTQAAHRSTAGDKAPTSTKSEAELAAEKADGIYANAMKERSLRGKQGVKK